MQANNPENGANPLSLSVLGSIGFNFIYKDCMVIHPSDLHFIWAEGRLLVIKSIGKEKNTYLKGHDGRISVI